MDCQEVDRKELAEKYVNGQLDLVLQDEFEIHILECPRCLWTLEVLQNVRDDLADLAHEIRAYSSVQRVRFRWQWIAAVPVLTIVAVVGFFRVWHLPPGPVLWSHTALNSPPPSEVPKDANTASGTGAKGRAPSAEHKSTKPRSTKPTPPTLAAGPDSSEAKPLASHESGAPAPGGQPNTTETANAPPSSHDQAPPSPGNNKTVSSATATKKPASETDEVAKERFRLGIVQPPPYTFSGFASSKGNPQHSDSSNSATSSKAGPTRSTDPRRPYFQNAMLAYLNRHYQDAADLLARDLRTEPEAADTNFYLGICKLLLGHPEEAVGPLKTTLKSNSPFSQSAHFYLAKAYLQMTNVPDAETEMQAAAAVPGPLTTEARLLLERIQSLRATR